MIKIVAIARKKFKIQSSIALYFFDIYNTMILPSTVIEHSTNLFICDENTFGGNEQINVGNDPIDYSNPRSTNNHSATLSIVFANVSGGLSNRMSTEKRESIRASTYEDSILLFNECNCVETDASFLAATYGIDARISAMSDFSYENGTRVMMPDGRRKLSGFGTAMITKKSNLIDFIDLEPHMSTLKYEVTAGYCMFKNHKGLIITGYRSPSMTNREEIDGFYRTIHNIIKKHYTNEVIFCLVCMDDNKTIASVQSLQEYWLQDKCQMKNMIGSQITRLVSSTQPDSVLCNFKPLTCTLRATVVSPLGRKMDHNAIRIRISGCNIVARKPRYREVTRKTRMKSDEDISSKLSEISEKFVESNAECLNVNDLDDSEVDKIAGGLIGLIKSTKDYGWKTTTSRLPDCLHEKADSWTVKIGIEHARMEKLGYHLKKHPKDADAYNKFVDAQTRCLQHMADKRDADCDRDMKHNMGDQQNGGKRMSNFYKWCDRFVSNKGSYLKKPLQKLSKQKQQQKLIEHDKTFVNDDPQFECNMLEMCSINADRNFTLESWRPSKKNTKLADFIRSRPKIDPFYKINADVIAIPIFLLLHVIEKTCFFPTAMRTSKATFIPGRTIFSLETLTKIIESVLGVELVECTEEHFRINGDPGGFAYRKARGVVSCLGLTLAALEKAPREELIDAIMNVVDLKKAFNTTKRSTVVEQAQKNCWCW